MGVKIYVEAKDIWSFYVKNKTRLKEEMVAIAENEETEYCIYLTEDCTYPFFTVYKSNKKILEEYGTSKRDCEETVSLLYYKYLFPLVVYQKEGDEDIHSNDDCQDSLQDMEDAIYEREDALYFAVAEMLQVLLQCKNMENLLTLYGGEIIEPLLNEICIHLIENYLISVYRPTWVDDGEGGEIFVEYPYGDDESEILNEQEPKE